MNGNGRLPARQTYTSRSCGRQRQGLRLASRPVTASSREKNAQISPAGAGEGSCRSSEAGLDKRFMGETGTFSKIINKTLQNRRSDAQSTAKSVHRVIRGA